MQIIKGRTVEHSGLHVPGRSVNASQLERWLGREQLENISRNMRDWYGPPIALTGVPGAVYAHKGGDFRGVLRAGHAASLEDHLAEGVARLRRAWRRAPKRQQLVMGAGFTGLADLVSESEHGKEKVFSFVKGSSGGTAARSMSLWGESSSQYPPSGLDAPAAPGGGVPTKDTSGAFYFDNPLAGDTRHIVRSTVTAGFPTNLLLYDRIFHVAKNLASTATEAVTGVPTRYQSTTQGAQDSAEGNFLFVETSVTLGAGAHDWTVCLYEDQSGNAGATLPLLTGNSGSSSDDFDHPLNQWFAPLASGDSGIKDLEQMQISLTITGTIFFVIGHPIAWLVTQLANYHQYNSYLYPGPMKLTRIFDGAALALIAAVTPNVTTFAGSFTTVDG